jgi:hypothetical protein
MSKLKTMQQQLAESEKAKQIAEKKSAELNKKIEAEKAKNKPKNIMERVKTFKDVLKIAKPIKEELVLINYNGKSKRLSFARDMMILSLISEVLNEGHVFTMSPDEERHYPWFYISSGFVFNFAHYNDTGAITASASRLCLKNAELAKYAGTIFIAYYKKAIMG